MSETEKEALFAEAESHAIPYLKEKFDLEVVITSRKLLPTMALSQVAMDGYVKGHEEQTFGISYDYKDKVVEDFIMSPEIVEAIRAKGYDPYAK